MGYSGSLRYVTYCLPYTCPLLGGPVPPAALLSVCGLCDPGPCNS